MSKPIAPGRVHALAVMLLVGSNTGAQTIEPLFDSSEDLLGNPVTYLNGTLAELTGSVVTIMPGDSTGWHMHAVPSVGYVLSGQLTVEYETGEVHVIAAGDGVIEAQDVAHNGHNQGAEPLRVVVFHAGAPGVSATQRVEPSRPEDFVDLRKAVPGLEIEMRYVGSNNFIGRPIAGYEASVLYLTREAATALAEVQDALATEGLGMKVFDGYRPQRAVDDFMQWASDPDDVAMKETFYPSVDKASLVPHGYIAQRSGHSRGSTVDVTLIDLGTGEELDMGSPYDFFDPISSPASGEVSASALENRMRLRDVMDAHGFEPLDEEWWHFSLRDEPYTDRYFDFPVR